MAYRIDPSSLELICIKSNFWFYYFIGHCDNTFNDITYNAFNYNDLTYNDNTYT